MKKAPKYALIFIVTLILVVLFAWFVLADIILERAVEIKGTEQLGALVELDKADVHIFPLGVEFYGLKVTNPFSPMTNAVEVEKISVELDKERLLKKKVLVNEMKVLGVRFGTPRKTSGEVPGAKRKLKAPPKKVEQKYEIPSFDIPDVDSLLKNEDLETIRLVNDTKAEIERQRELWEKRLEELPNQKKIDDYRARIKKLEGAGDGGVLGILGAATEINDLREDITADLELVERSEKDFEALMKDLKDRVKQVQTAPRNDINRLSDKYGMSSEGLKNLSGLVFGREFAEKVSEAVYWYETALPYVQEAKRKQAEKKAKQAAEPKPADTGPEPKLHIKKTIITILLKNGEFAGEALDISNEQHKVGRPMRFTLSGSGVKGMRSIELNGTMDRTDPSAPKDTITFMLRGYEAKDITISESEKLPVRLVRGDVSMDVYARLAGRNVNADVKTGLGGIDLQVDIPAGSGEFVTAMAGALEGVSSFTASAKITGTLDDYSISISSDIDKVLRDAAGRLVQAQVAKLETKITDYVNERVEGPVADVLAGYGGLDKVIGGELQKRVDELGRLI